MMSITIIIILAISTFINVLFIQNKVRADIRHIRSERKLKRMVERQEREDRLKWESQHSICIDCEWRAPEAGHYKNCPSCNSLNIYNPFYEFEPS